MSTEQNPAKAYPISTLRDVFNLPTWEKMVICLDEIRDAMSQAREVSDLVTQLAAEKGETLENPVVWPETFEWIDDGKGEVCTTFSGPDGKELLSIQTTRAAEAPKGQTPEEKP